MKYKEIKIEEVDDEGSGATEAAEPLPRRSTRTTAGKHSNPFHLPKVAVVEANKIEAEKQEALVNLSCAHVALVEIFKFSNP